MVVWLQREIAEKLMESAASGYGVKVIRRTWQKWVLDAHTAIRLPYLVLSHHLISRICVDLRSQF